MKNLPVIAFCFARGGSKGLPGKNLRLLGGKPLIAHSIEVGKACRGVSRMIVSTDSQEIADTASAFGAEVPFLRPAPLASDTAPEWEAWRHAILQIKQGTPRLDDFIFLSLPATSPLRDVEDVDRALDRFEQGDVDVVITVTESHRSPYFNMIKMDAGGAVELVCPPPPGLARRQDAPQVFDITTVAYVMKASFIERCHGLFEGRVGAITVPSERASDIDTAWDFEIAELLWKRQHPSL